MVSVVAHRDLQDSLLVRARKREHLVAALGAEDGIEETPSADYRFRATLKREHWATRIAQLASETDYGNFKSSIRDPKLHDVAMKCWRAHAEAYGSYGRQPTP